MEQPTNFEVLNVFSSEILVASFLEIDFWIVVF